MQKQGAGLRQKCAPSVLMASAMCSQSCSHTELNELFLPQPLNFPLQWVCVMLLNKLCLRVRNVNFAQSVVMPAYQYWHLQTMSHHSCD